MQISSVSFAARQKGVNNTTSVKAEPRVIRPKQQYSEGQVLWNSYGDSVCEVGDLTRAALNLSEQIYNETDPKKREALEEQKRVLEEQKEKAELHCKQNQKALWAYRAQYGIA